MAKYEKKQKAECNVSEGVRKINVAHPKRNTFMPCKETTTKKHQTKKKSIG